MLSGSNVQFSARHLLHCFQEISLLRPGVFFFLSSRLAVIRFPCLVNGTKSHTDGALSAYKMITAEMIFRHTLAPRKPLFSTPLILHFCFPWWCISLLYRCCFHHLDWHVFPNRFSSLYPASPNGHPPARHMFIIFRFERYCLSFVIAFWYFCLNVSLTVHRFVVLCIHPLTPLWLKCKDIELCF